MDTLTTIFALTLLVASILLSVKVRPFSSRKYYSQEEEDKEAERIAHREALREFHRLRRERDKVWFSVDKMHDEFVQKTSSEKPAIEPPQADSPPRVSDGNRDNWNDATLENVKEKYQSFLKED